MLHSNSQTQTEISRFGAVKGRLIPGEMEKVAGALKSTSLEKIISLPLLYPRVD